ncbi:hypothetical protein MGAD_46190 [Mycolicibacterium gadium]|uniref:Uncharacterized protein n=1 Tax=Mycolicibacterium gadium TaxID=1794 RepID=A0A7I7WRZ2_MYCGU|nr:hypothetical protein MGAD_46190 [Mycolicibacterium gadium]
MQPLKGRQVLELGTRDPVHGARRRPSGCGIDDHDPRSAAHLERHIHPCGAAVNQSGTVGYAALPQMTNQDRADTVIAAQQIPAPDNEHRTTRRLDVDIGSVAVRARLRSRGNHTIPLITNLDSSRPDLPS